MEKYLQETKMLDFSNQDIQQLIADKDWISQTACQAACKYGKM